MVTLGVVGMVDGDFDSDFDGDPVGDSDECIDGAAIYVPINESTGWIDKISLKINL